MKPYKTTKSGEWFALPRRNYKLACCDCGLVHKVDFKLVKGQLFMRVWRDGRATGGKRSHINKRVRPTLNT